MDEGLPHPPVKNQGTMWTRCGCGPGAEVAGAANPVPPWDMARNRWPGIAPPGAGGVAVHGHRVLIALPEVAMQLTGVTAYPTGVSLSLVLVATGSPAERARHETRPLTDPRDRSARWSYLRVRIRMDDQAGDADPYEPVPCAPPSAPPEQYRTAPSYWIPGYPRTGTLTLTTGWHQIGLPVSVDVLDLGVSPFSTESG